MRKKDIVIFLSDQHTPLLSSFMGGPARTPALQDMCGTGVNFANAYTNCPLCVPARMSMLSGRMPSDIGVLTNSDTLPDTTPTFIHSLAAAGYETVLIGRMHFIGANQRHGFEHRLIGDTTPVTWNRPLEKLREVRGVHTESFTEGHCLDVIGGGASPVQEYDRQVVQAAVEWLCEPHERPQFILVGTYGPHFPYVAPARLYEYYKSVVKLPFGFENLPDYLDPVYRLWADSVPAGTDTALRAMAAYCGMIEETDCNLQTVRQAFMNWKEKQGRQGVFCYISDHGDQCGERRLYGKSSIFEKAVRIPWLMEGEGIPKGKRVDTPVSLIDLSPTICAIAGAEPPFRQDGADILANGACPDALRPVVSEVFASSGPLAPAFVKLNPERRLYPPTLSRMARKGRYKYATRNGFEKYDLLFDLESDPDETTNLIDRLPDVARELRAHLSSLPQAEKVEALQLERAAAYALFMKAEAVQGGDSSELWTDNPDRAKLPPQLL